MEKAGCATDGKADLTADHDLSAQPLRGSGRQDPRQVRPRRRVVNSTGHPASGEILELTDGQWHEALDLVVLNVVRIARLVTPAMLRQGGGAIVNISTFSAFEPSPTFPLSSSLRAALAGFTKLYADRYAAEGVRMNNVLPGYIESFEIDEETRESIPMRRQGSVAEIAKTATFLLSEDSGYITGQNIRVDGGLTRSI